MAEATPLAVEFRALTMKYVKNFDQARFPPEYWEDLKKIIEKAENPNG